MQNNRQTIPADGNYKSVTTKDYPGNPGLNT